MNCTLIILLIPPLYVLIGIVWHLICRMDSIDNQFDKFNKGVLFRTINSIKASIEFVASIIKIGLAQLQEAFRSIPKFSRIASVDNSWRNDSHTEKQAWLAQKLNVKFDEDTTKGELSDLISEAKGQDKAEVRLFNQPKCLHCGGGMSKRRVSAMGTGCFIVAIGICLTPFLIGIPIVIYGLCYSGGIAWICDNCGIKTPTI